MNGSFDLQKRMRVGAITGGRLYLTRLRGRSRFGAAKARFRLRLRESEPPSPSRLRREGEGSCGGRFMERAEPAAPDGCDPVDLRLRAA